ncbi:hypothetical protein CVT25_002585 [Psilocybe cyanescens]|uniref:Uncharacterized protein n=1 Tax=Psilocybe cyanescens TaxID=93625 RepID=A0A409WLC3_PSICY|nr:hypothetical protein CVT25_002585 [Psilocybe cyanescens]
MVVAWTSIYTPANYIPHSPAGAISAAEAKGRLFNNRRALGRCRDCQSKLGDHDALFGFEQIEAECNKFPGTHVFSSFLIVLHQQVLDVLLASQLQQIAFEARVVRDGLVVENEFVTCIRSPQAIPYYACTCTPGSGDEERREISRKPGSLVRPVSHCVVKKRHEI